MLNLTESIRKYEKNGRTFAELMPFMIMPTESLILNKDGSLMAFYEITGIDYEGLEQFRIDSTSNLTEQAFRVFDNRCTIWLHVDRRKTKAYPEGGEFPDEISKFVDDEWQSQFTEDGGSQYVNRCFVSILFAPSSGVDGFFDKMGVYQKDGYSPIKSLLFSIRDSMSKQSAFALSQADIDKNIFIFEEMLLGFQETLDSIGVDRLVHDQILSYLHERCSPASAGNNVKMPDIPCYLDAWLPDNTLNVYDNVLKFENEKTTYISVISVKDMPTSTAPGILDILLSTPGEITISQCFRIVDRSDAETFIAKKQKEHLAAAKPITALLKETITGESSSNLNRGKLALSEDAAEALIEVTAENRAFGYYNLTVLAYGETEKDSKATLSEISKILRYRGYLLVVETLNALSAWAGTVPGQWSTIIRWYFLSGANLADMAPVRTLKIGDIVNQPLSTQAKRELPALTVFKTELYTPYYFNFHQSDLAHTMVVGPSRMGKSALMNFLISQFRT